MPSPIPGISKSSSFVAVLRFTWMKLIGNRFWPSGALARSLKPKACVSMGAG